MVKTAFAFAAAEEKSLTVFKSPARRSTIPLASKATNTRSEVVFINFVQTEVATDLHRFSRITDEILLNLCFICVHLWRSDQTIPARFHSRLFRDLANRIGSDFHGAWHNRVARTSAAASLSRNRHGIVSGDRFYFSRQN